MPADATSNLSCTMHRSASTPPSVGTATTVIYLSPLTLLYTDGLVAAQVSETERDLRIDALARDASRSRSPCGGSP
jgi:uncharacterized metal-binding protein